MKGCKFIIYNLCKTELKTYKPLIEIKSNDDLTDALNPDDLSLDLIIKEAVKESLDDWFSRNLKTIVEESVKQEISKLFKKRN